MSDLIVKYHLISLQLWDNYMNINNRTSPQARTVEQRMEAIISTDETRDVMLIASEISKCIVNEGLNLQQIETVLREKNCFTYLIARKRNPSHGENLTFKLPKGTLKTYFLFLSTKDPEQAKRELLEESESYRENFKKLKDTGFICISEDVPVASQFKSGTLELL